MGYFNSVIVLQKNSLYKATIRYTYFYFFQCEEHESFKTLSEAKDWILSRRCPEHEEITSHEQTKIESEIIGNAFVNDSDSESELLESDSEDKKEFKL